MAFEIKHALTMTAPDDPAFENNPSDWNAALVVAGADVGGIPYCPTATTIATSANLTFDGTTLSTTRLGVAAGTLTTDVQIANFSATWNAAGVTFEGLRVTITDTASAAASIAMQILGGASGATNLLSVDKLGASRSESFYATGGTFGCRTSTATLSAVYMFDAGSSVGLIGFTSNTASGVFWANSSNDAGQAKDTGLTRVSAGVVGVGTGGAASVAGTISAAAYVVGGAAGADFGPGLPTSITVVKGIITAIS